MAPIRKPNLYNNSTNNNDSYYFLFFKNKVYEISSFSEIKCIIFGLLFLGKFPLYIKEASPVAFLIILKNFLSLSFLLNY